MELFGQDHTLKFKPLAHDSRLHGMHISLMTPFELDQELQSMNQQALNRSRTLVFWCIVLQVIVVLDLSVLGLLHNHALLVPAMLLFSLGFVVLIGNMVVFEIDHFRHARTIKTEIKRRNTLHN